MPVAPQHAGKLPEDMRRVPVPHHVLDICDRIQRGDGLWRGDLTMGVYYDPDRDVYEVVGLDAMQQPYIAATSRTCDQRLIDQLIAGDWQRGGVFEAVVKANERLRKAQEAAEDEFHEERADKLAHAIRKDAHHIAGVSSRDIWSINWDRPRPADMVRP
jgi:hypothetical protein